MPKAGTGAVIPDEGPLPVLRTGVDSPKINDEIELKFVASKFSSATYLEFSTTHSK